jgi:hypothetical protein
MSPKELAARLLRKASDTPKVPNLAIGIHPETGQYVVSAPGGKTHYQGSDPASARQVQEMVRRGNAGYLPGGRYGR